MQRLDPIVLGFPDLTDATITLADDGDPAGQDRMLRNVTIPTLTPFLPDPATRTGVGVVVAPGGALHFLAVDNEGMNVWRNASPIRGSPPSCFSTDSSPRP